MSKSKIALVSLLVIAAAAVLYFSYGIVKERYFAGEKKEGTDGMSVEQSQSGIDGNDDGQTDEEQGREDSDAGAEAAGGQNTATSGSYIFINRQDCDKNCEEFKDYPEDLKYCQEVCGIIPISGKKSTEECGGFQGRERDYCLRDVAVSNSNSDVCEEIKDSQIKRMCYNRIAEDLLN